MSSELFRPHEASRTYASAAAVLAGFCFAAVVLIVTIEQGTNNLKAQAEFQAAAGALTNATKQGPNDVDMPNQVAHAKAEARALADRTFESGSFDRAIGALLSAFVGLVMSSFLMARVGGRAGVDDHDRSRLGVGPLPTTRTFWLLLMASTGLTTSALFALWGLAELIDVVLEHDGAATLVWLVFGFTSLLAAAFVAAAACDLLANDSSAPAPRWWVLMFVASLGGTSLFFIGLLFYSLFAGHWAVPTTETPIYPIAIIHLAGFSTVVLGALGLSSSNEPDVPKWLRGDPGAIMSCLPVAVPVAVAWALILRLPVSG